MQLVYAMHAYKHVSMNFIQNIRIPEYDDQSKLHSQIATHSRHAHELALLAYTGDDDAAKQLRQVEDEVDQAAAALWGLTDQELADVRASLQELKGD